jgi:hypothetical protein
MKFLVGAVREPPLRVDFHDKVMMSDCATITLFGGQCPPYTFRLILEIYSFLLNAET